MSPGPIISGDAPNPKLPYVEIDIGLIEPGSPLGFGLYRLARDGQPMLIIEPDEYFSAEVKRKLVTAASQFYTSPAGRSRYLTHLERSLQQLIADKSKIPEARDRAARMVYRLAEDRFRDVFESPSPQTINQADQVVQSAVRVMMSDNRALGVMARLAKHDGTTHTHCCNVGVFTMGLIRELLEEGESHPSDLLATAFFFHDVGKVEIDLEIINKPGPLDIWETNQVRRHTKTGLKIMREAGLLTNIAAVVISQHHERQDGSGYPAGLMGENIHPYARICAIADVFDALTSERPYRPRMNAYQALKVMRDNMPGHFDPLLLRRFIAMFARLTQEAPLQPN